jgi:hypothetical protein
MLVLKLINASSVFMFELGSLAVWIIDRATGERGEIAFVEVRDDVVDIEPCDVDPLRGSGGRLTLAVDSVLTDWSRVIHVGLSVENVDCAGIPERLIQDGGSVD